MCRYSSSFSPEIADYFSYNFLRVYEIYICRPRGNLLVLVSPSFSELGAVAAPAPGPCPGPDAAAALTA